MSEADQDQLIADHFMFDKPVSPLLTASRMARDWPDARGKYLYQHPHPPPLNRNRTQSHGAISPVK